MTRREFRLRAVPGWTLCIGLLFPGVTSADLAPDGRLTRAVVPMSESIRIDIDPNTVEYSGSVIVELQVREAATRFNLHALGLTLGEMTMRGASGAVPVTHREAAPGIIEIETATPLAPGAYGLEIAFKGKQGSRAVGIFRVESGGSSHIYTMFEPNHAREAFPCWDEPSFKIPYQITLNVPKALFTVSNTPIESETVSGESKTVVFSRTKPLPSYLLAFAAGNLEAVPISGLSVPGRVVTVAGRTAQGGEAIKAAGKLLPALEKWFGTPYPFEKLDLVAVPETATFSGMEHPGAITFSETALLADPATVTTAQRREIVGVIAHELAHMWFGDLVTMEWWDDVWLNESFASWIGDKICDQIYPEYRTGLESQRSKQGAMRTDAQVAAVAMRRPIKASDSVFSSDFGMAYSKGQATLNMTESWLGPEKFRRGVIDYLAAHARGNAVAADLWGSLGKAGGQDVGSVLSSFLDQPGVPLIIVEPLGGEKVRIRQTRFLNHGARAPGPQSWMVPVSLRYADAEGLHEKSLLMTEPETTIDLPAAGPISWIHPNAGERGYYRWSLPDAGLDALMKDADRKMSPEERIGLVGNLGALQTAGRIRGDSYLRALRALSSDTDTEVIAMVVEALGGVKYVFVTPGLESPFAAYVKATLGPALVRIGMAPAKGEPDSVTTLRPVLVEWVGDEGEDRAVRSWAWEATKDWLEGSSKADASLVPKALSLAAIDGKRDLYEPFRKRLESSTNPIERRWLLSAMGNFRDPGILEEALAYSLSGRLAIQEFLIIPYVSMSTEERRQRVFRWMTENYTTVAARLPDEVRSLAPVRFIGGCSLERLEAGEKFFADPARANTASDRALIKLREQVTDCLSLREREGARAGEYLRASAGR